MAWISDECQWLGSSEVHSCKLDLLECSWQYEWFSIVSVSGPVKHIRCTIFWGNEMNYRSSDIKGKLPVFSCSTAVAVPEKCGWEAFPNRS